jgi:hypothetical protein
MSKHRPGVREGFLVTHKLKLDNLSAENAEQIRADIDAMISIDGVWIDLDQSTIKIAYDASHHDIDEMRDIIRRHGAEISPDWWNQWKLSWDRQTDSNVRHNAELEPSCCSKIPSDFKPLK